MSTEYRVVWKREGTTKRTELRQTRAGALGKMRQSRSASTSPRGPADEYGHPGLLDANGVQREVGAWEPAPSEVTPLDAIR